MKDVRSCGEWPRRIDGRPRKSAFVTKPSSPLKDCSPKSKESATRTDASNLARFQLWWCRSSPIIRLMQSNMGRTEALVYLSAKAKGIRIVSSSFFNTMLDFWNKPTIDTSSRMGKRVGHHSSTHKRMLHCNHTSSVRIDWKG